MTDIVKKVYDTVDDNHRVFLVVVDDSEEMLVAHKDWLPGWTQ